MTGPLAGLRVVELASIGPGPHAVMILADLGADVVRVERTRTGPRPDDTNQTLRNRRLVTLDLKSAVGRDATLALIDVADVLVEGFRPGVTERLGLGPDVCTNRNPSLIYARMTGWGQHGPMYKRAGHDINYLSVTGALHAIGRDGQRPVPPLNLVGDFGGGSMFMVTGILAALWERSTSGLGQVVDASIVDGVSNLMQIIWSLRHQGRWTDDRESNLLDGGAPFYDTYTCKDGRFMAVGAIEAKFYAHLLKGLGVDHEDPTLQNDRAEWPRLRQLFSERFASRNRDEWAAVFDEVDACTTPVLDLAEASRHPHMVARSSLVELDGITQSAPAPRFSRSAPDRPTRPATTPDPVGPIIEEWQMRR